MVDSLHTSEIPVCGALIKVVHTDCVKKKSSNASVALTPRKRASTLGVISELPNQELKKQPSEKMVCQPRSRLMSSTSTSSLGGESWPVVSGQIKAFGDKADRSNLKIEDRVVVHPADPAPSTSYLRDIEFRVVSDITYLVPIEPSIPLKLAAMLGGRGLSIYNAVVEIMDYIKTYLSSNQSNNKNELLKVLVICNDEFSMMAVQILNYLMKLENDPTNILLAIAALKDDGLMWYKKNMPMVKLVQWEGDAYDQDLLERTRDACQGDVDIVIGCINLGAPLQRSFKCLKKGGIAFLTEEMNDKVLKSLEKLAVQQSRKLKVVERCGDHDLGNLAKLLKLVKDGHVQPAFLQDDQQTAVQLNMNPVEMRRKARSLSSRAPTRVSALQE